jgi:hypothetical protein
MPPLCSRVFLRVTITQSALTLVTGDGRQNKTKRTTAQTSGVFVLLRGGAMERNEKCPTGCFELSAIRNDEGVAAQP